MIKRGMNVLVAGFGCILLAGSAVAQSPSSLADSSAEYNAYVYSYNSRATAIGLTNAITTGAESEVAQLVADYCEEGFFHCYDALVDDDDQLWGEAVDDLENALYWCDTLSTFSQNSQSSATLWQIETLKWYLEIAIENAEDAMPPPLWYVLPNRYPYQFNRQRVSR